MAYFGLLQLWLSDQQQASALLFGTSEGVLGLTRLKV